MRKLVLVTLALAMIVSLSMGAVSSAGWYGDVYTDGYVDPNDSSKYYGKAWGTKYLPSYTGHGLVKIGYWNNMNNTMGTVMGTGEVYNYPYSGSVVFSANRTATGNSAYCLSEVTGSDGRTYTQNSYH